MNFWQILIVCATMFGIGIASSVCAMSQKTPRGEVKCMTIGWAIGSFLAFVFYMAGLFN